MGSKNINLLVTGGAGFIGSHLTDELLDRGYNVVVLDNLRNGSMNNLKQANKLANFKFIEGDILNMDDCLQSTQNIDVVYHLACLGVRHSIHSPLENHRVNAEGTLNILEACRKNGVKKFFYISTSEVYGGTDMFPINETALPKPFTVYGASKLVGEHYTNAYKKCYGLNITILRMFNNFGPRAHYEGDAGEIIPRSIVKIINGSQPVIFGDGSITRDFFYVRDTAKALSSLIDIPDINGITMNLGAGIEYSMKYVIETVLKLMNKIEMGMRYMEDRPADVPRLWVDAQKFKVITGFKSEFSFEEGLRETISYYKNLSNEKDLLSEIIEKNWEK